ncbi:hypothetical protein BGZ65_006424, partial [Modicella reniformis]
HIFTIRGSADATISTSGGPFIQKTFQVTNIGFGSPITLKGCSSFPKVDYLSQDSLTFDSNTGVFTLTSQVNVYNPSNFVLDLGEVSLETVKNSLVIGITVLKDMKLNMGDNHLTAITTSTNKEVYEALINAGDTFTLQGYKGSSKNPILTESLQAFKSQVVVPKLNRILF